MIVDLFAGPGGWDEALEMLGVNDDVIGLEWDKAACDTAIAAGHARYRGDLSMVAVDKFGPITGLIASPPCQAYSTAGKGLGKLDQPRILRHLERIREAGKWLHYSREGWHDDRSPLVLEPVRWALLGRPDWIALGQVPAVLPFWQAFGDILGDHGYTWSAGILSSERFGVPQTRKRAILVARLSADSFRSRLPMPTHQAYSKAKPFDPASLLPRWVSMAEALGWGFDTEPAKTVTAGGTGSGGGVEVFGYSGYRKRLAEHVNRPVAMLNKQRDRQPDGSLTPRYHDFDAPAPTVALVPNQWVMNAAGASSHVVKPRGDDMPAATITGKGTAAWIWTNQKSEGSDDYYKRGTDLPSPVVTGNARSYQWVHDAPATTVQGDPRVAPRGHHDRQFGGETVRVSVAEAATLQSFPTGYPWHGTKTKQYEQVGNAIPPLLAAAVLGNLLGVPWHHVAHSMRPVVELDAAA